MKLLKIFSIGFFVFCSLVFGSSVLAVETPPAPAQATNPTPKKDTITIAEVNLYNARIVSQKGNVFNIASVISNKKGIQTGLKYGVSLLKDTKQGKLSVDEYVYPEAFSLSENTTISKNVIYTAPANLSGDYTIIVKIMNESGIPMGLGAPGKVKLTSSSDIVEILTDTCSLSVSGEKDSPKYSLTKGVDISSKENIVLTCTAINSSKKNVQVVPSYETHYRTLFGDIVPDNGGSLDPISFKAGEKKSISLTLPKASAPQVYNVKMSLKQGDAYSNSIVSAYVIRGANATIANISLDKDVYSSSDTAKIYLVWANSADNFPGNRAGKEGSVLKNVTLVASIKNDKQQECISPINKILENTSFVEISAPIISKCKNPQVSVELKDSEGKTLDSKQFSFTTKEVPNTSFANYSKIIFIILGVLVVAGIAFYFIKIKRKGQIDSNLIK